MGDTPKEPTPAAETATEPQERQPEPDAAAPIEARKVRRGGQREDRVRLYDELLHAFEKYPGQTKVVGKLCGVTKETARRAWERGWEATPSKPALKPIRDAIADQSLAIRATLYDKEAKDLATKRARQLLEDAAQQTKTQIDQARNEAAAIIASAEKVAKERMAELLRKAKLDSAQSIADRAQMLSLGRKGAIAAVALPALVLQNVQDIAAMISKAIRDGEFKTPNEAIAAGVMLTKMVENSERALFNYIQSENLNAGRPTEVLGMHIDEIPVEEVEKRMRVLARALEDQKKRQSPSGEGTSGTATGDHQVH